MENDIYIIAHPYGFENYFNLLDARDIATKIFSSQPEDSKPFILYKVLEWIYSSKYSSIITSYERIEITKEDFREIKDLSDFVRKVYLFMVQDFPRPIDLI